MKSKTLAVGFTAAAVTVMVAVPAHAAGTDYYLTPDSGGTAPAGASPVAQVPSLGPGDTLHLSGTYTRKITVWEAGGTEANPVRIIGDQAEIRSTEGTGLMVGNSSNVEVSGINLEREARSGVGIMVWQEGAETVTNISFSDVHTNGFRMGLYAEVKDSSAGPKIDGLAVRDSTFARAGNTNLATHAEKGTRGIANVVIEDVVVRDAADVEGDNTGTNGSGMFLGGVSGAEVRRVHAYNNGHFNDKEEGGEGIWAYSANDVLIEDSLSENNNSRGTDGNGIGFDVDTFDSIIRNNTTRNNGGAGYQVYTHSDWADARNILVENNVSEFDAARPGFSWTPIVIGAVVPTQEGPSHVRDTIVRNNKIVMADDDPRCAITVHNQVSNVEVTDNERVGGACMVDNNAADPSQVHGSDVDGSDGEEPPTTTPTQPTTPAPPAPQPEWGSSGSSSSGTNFFSWLGSLFGGRR